MDYVGDGLALPEAGDAGLLGAEEEPVDVCVKLVEVAVDEDAGVEYAMAAVNHVVIHGDLCVTQQVCQHHRQCCCSVLGFRLNP